VAESDVLLQRLLEAESAAQADEFVAANLEAVLAAFPGWTTVPAQIRADPAAVNRYGNAIILVAQILKARGHPGPLRALRGGRDDNPLHRWENAFTRSQALAAAGRHTESIEVLSSLLAELDQVSGSAVDDIRAKVFGALSTVWFQAGDISQAFHWTQRALQACVASDDTQGISTYRENLQVLDALYLPTVDPQAGGRLLQTRRLIASAQAASDDFDYAESNQILDQALAIIEQGDEHLRSSFAGKIYGLRGWNHFHLGDKRAARADTDRALAECRAADDPDGIRIYTANAASLAQRKAPL
jgi:tetratricopeptide (TPR) repeat protein